jgi:photosystem II stability/assembly factor-like uncharacterized protein
MHSQGYPPSAAIRLARVLLIAGVTIGTAAGLVGQEQARNEPFDNLAFRALGPGLTSGRISDIEVDPKNPNVWYAAAASGNLWKTDNRGNTWSPIFETYGSYSLGAVVVDPRNSDIVWLATGENNNQRSVGFGDGLYKSADAGKTWKRVGLENSEHIQNILIDPRNSNVVYVSAIGPLWSAGGDRGLYKTTDGGATWKAVLTISPDTGVTDVVMDPKRPDILYAAAYQRRRAVGQLIGGGPESGLYKTTDGGAKWTKLTKGLPAVEIGRIGLGINWRNPNTVYALVTAQRGQGGFFRSDDAGASWTRVGRTVANPGGRGRGGAPAQQPAPCGALSASAGGAPVEEDEPEGGRGRGRGGPQDDCYRGGDPGYYNEIIVDPNDPETIWSPQTYMYRSQDGGRTWREVELDGVHVDHHDMVGDPADKNHYLIASDGGIYETYDNFRTFRHFTNLPLSQFYRINTDNSRPFYRVCGGAQDNGTICGPSRTLNRGGIRTSDWYTVGGGDGFQARVDPEDPNIVYAQSQNGSLSRLDLRTGQSVSIRPSARNTLIPGAPAPPPAAAPPTGGQGGGRGGAFGRWHWDAPLIISPHHSRRLYYAGDKLYRSDNRGDAWTAISGDLTRNLDRTKIPIMGKVWPADSVAYMQATTTLSTVTTIDESPLREGLLITGSDDGLVHISEDGGKNWRKIENLPGVPPGSYVTDVYASPRDVDAIFLTINNYQRGDFKPYVLKSGDRGRTWASISGNLPARSGAWSIVQDHVNGNLLFAGMEFGVFFTVDGGKSWAQLRGGIPTTQARDLEIQRREGDLVVGSFGRGAYVLDDYTALRDVTAETLQSEGTLYRLRDAYQFDELNQVRPVWGDPVTPNPPYGAIFTYSVGKVPEGDATLVVQITDDGGREIRRLEIPRAEGLNRIAWNLRGEAPQGRAGGPGAGGGGGGGAAQGPPVAPGRYRAALAKVSGGTLSVVGETRIFNVVPLPR